MRVFSSFTNGYPVVATVRAVNEDLKKRGMPSISVVIGCNQFETTEGVKTGDFSFGDHVVYAVGEKIWVRHAGMSDDGKIYFKIYAQDFWNLDEVAVGQQIQLIDEHK